MVVQIKMKSYFLIVFLCMLTAIFLGVYAQSIASIFTDDWYMVMLTATTIISIILFAIAIIMQFMILISEKVKSRLSSIILTTSLLMTVIISLYISWWSFFILAMSWG